MGIAKLGVSGVSPLMIRNVLEFSRRFELDPDDVSRCVKVHEVLPNGHLFLKFMLSNFKMKVKTTYQT